VYLFISVWGAFMQSRNEFYVLAVTVGLFRERQALSRSLCENHPASEKSAEIFGFYNMIGKFATDARSCVHGRDRPAE
jgi:UMF1 family MFS transporter